MAQTDMMAPSPFFETWTRGSRLYKADADGLIENVDGRDIGDLLGVGCVDARNQTPTPAPTQVDTGEVEAASKRATTAAVAAVAEKLSTEPKVAEARAAPAPSTAPAPTNRLAPKE